MFNGIIKKTGKIKKITKSKKNFFIEIISNIKFLRSEIGSSISCSGACLSLDKQNGKTSRFFISKETLDKTNFKYSKIGDIINLEKSIKFGEPISGHIIQGHVDTTSQIRKIKFVGKSWYIDMKVSKKYRSYLIQKGSISINGVSLTISKIYKQGFQVVIIPQTLKLTNLIYLKEKDFVNLEFDILGKYVKKYLK